MAFITTFFIKPKKPALVQLPTGSFTIDRNGRILTSTFPQSFQAAHLRQIGNQILAAFRSAKNLEMRFVEIVVQYSALKLVAREQCGGAVVFVMPHNLTQPHDAKPSVQTWIESK